MQDFNNIDDLFRKKLTNREVAYSASSWAGAEQLLNKHYKWLFLKKLLFTLLPATIVSAAGVIYLMNSEPATLQTLNEKTVPVQIEATATEPIKERDRALVAPSPVTKSQGNIDEMYLRESRNTRPVAVSQEAVAAKDVPGPEPVSASVAARLTANARSTRSLNNSPASTDAGQPAVAATPSTNHKVPIAEDLGALLDEVFAPGSRPGSATLVVPGNDHTAASATMDGMPKFTISKIGSGNGSALADADRKAGEPLMNKLHKLDLALDGGGLVARGFLNAAARRERVSPGCYAALTAEYHVNQNLFVSSGAGLFSRGSLAGEQLLSTGTNTTTVIDPRSAIYLNIPFKLGYRISARHSLAFGMQFSQLMTVVARKETIVNGEAGGNRGMVADKSGFNPSDIAGVLAYKVALTERLNGGAEFQYGLFDVTDNQFFRSGDISDRNTILRFGVSYRLLNR